MCKNVNIKNYDQIKLQESFSKKADRLHWSRSADFCLSIKAFETVPNTLNWVKTKKRNHPKFQKCIFGFPELYKILILYNSVYQIIYLLFWDDILIFLLKGS